MTTPGQAVAHDSIAALARVMRFGLSLLSRTPSLSLVAVLLRELNQIPGLGTARLTRLDADTDGSTLVWRIGTRGYERLLVLTPTRTTADPDVSELLDAVAQVFDVIITRAAEWHDTSPWPQEVVDRVDTLHALVEGTGLIVVLLRPDGSWQASSTALSTVLGLPRLGQHPEGLFSLVHPDDRESAARTLAAAGKGNDGAVVELRMRTVDGRWRVIETYLRDLRWQPSVESLVLYGRDITDLVAERREYEAQRVRLNAAARALPMGVLVEDSDGGVVLANPALFDLLGPRWPGVHGAGSGRDAVPRAMAGAFADPEAFLRHAEAARAGGTAVRPARLRLDGGRTVDVGYQRLPAPAGGACWWLADVTDQAEARRARADRNEAMAELARLRSEFAGAVVAALRPPLTAIAAHASTIHASTTDAGTGTSAAAIARHAGSAGGLVDDLALLLPGERQASDSVDVRALLSEIVEQWRPLANATEVLLVGRVRVGPHVRCIEADLRQALGGLVGATVVAVPSGGRVVLSGAPRAGGWRILLRATEPGLADETPLALLVLRGVVERHGGAVNVRRMPEMTAVAIDLPWRPPDGMEGSKP